MNDAHTPTDADDADDDAADADAADGADGGGPAPDPAPDPGRGQGLDGVASGASSLAVRWRAAGSAGAAQQRAVTLEAARGIGLGDLSVDAVAAACGMDFPHEFYGCWRSIDQLRAALIDHVLADLVVHTLRRGVVRGEQGWAARLRSACAVLAGLLDTYPGLAAAVLTRPGLPGPLRDAHTALTEHLALAGLAHGDAEAVVTTALRATLAAAAGAAAQLPSTAPDVGLPRVVLDALAATHAYGAGARAGIGPDPRCPDADFEEDTASALIELGLALRAGTARLDDVTLRRSTGHPASLTVRASWPSEPR